MCPVVSWVVVDVHRSSPLSDLAKVLIFLAVRKRGPQCLKPPKSDP